MTKPDRRQALIDLVALPNPIGRYGHRRTCEGKPDRFRQVARNSAAFVQAHQLEQSERELSAAVQQDEALPVSKVYPFPVQREQRYA